MRIVVQLLAMTTMSNNIRRLLIAPTEEGLNQAAKLLREGQLLAFPTETVYGLGADATNVEAVLNIFKAKGRPLTDPLIVHVAKSSDAESLIELQEEENVVFQTLGSAFWPGPLTQIVKASRRIPGPVTANTGFVGIRCPKHRLAQALLERAQVPVAAPSANRFGHVSPTRAEHVLADLADKEVMVLDGESNESIVPCEPCEFGIESTVIKLERESREVLIFRQGAVTQREIEDLFAQKSIAWRIRPVLRTVKMHSTAAVPEPQPTAIEGSDSLVHADAEDGESSGQVAPGQAVTHYAPDIPCFILRGIQLDVSNDTTDVPQAGSAQEQRIFDLSRQEMQEKVVLIDFGGQYQDWKSKVHAYRDLSASGDAGEAAKGLFDILRWSEQVEGAQYVLISPILHTDDVLEAARTISDISLGVADRVFRAASGVSAVVRIR
jgi:tRNA threonylcarbamoyl adenosine modification protein (Sua5/YciO/YrdC/YwlC family)